MDEVLTATLVKYFGVGAIGLVLGGLVTFYVVRAVSKKYLDEVFDNKRLKLEHDYTTTLESKKKELEATFSRIVKVHEREYEVLPKAWYLLCAACGTADVMTKMPEQHIQRAFDNASQAWKECNDYFVENRIFMTAELTDVYFPCVEMLSQGVKDYHRGLVTEDSVFEEGGLERIESARKRLPQVEALIQKRLHFENA